MSWFTEGEWIATEPNFVGESKIICGDYIICDVAGGLHESVGNARILADAPALLDALEEVTDDLECELMARYPADSRAYPNENRRFERDMEPVRKARALIAKHRGGK